MQTIQVGRFNRLLQKYLSMKADPPAGDLAGEIMPTLPLETPGMEYYYLNDTKICCSGATIAAAVGQPPRFRFRNPQGSGVIAVVLQLYVGTDLAGVFSVTRHGTTSVDLGTTFVERTLDSRYPVAGAAACSVSTDNTGAAGVGNTAYRIATPAGAQMAVVQFPLRALMVLTPGDGMDISTAVTNINEYTTIVWSERAIEDSELQ